MGDEFGTVNVRRAERTREIEILSQHYREHRDTLNMLAQAAPTDFLATEYQRLITEIDNALAKLHELEGHGEGAPRPKTQPGTRPIVHSPAVGTDPGAPRTYVSSAASADTRSRMIAMILAGIIVLGLIGWLIWRAGSDRSRSAAPVVEQRPTTTETTLTDTAASSTIAPVTPAPADTGTVAPVPTANALTVKPALADYGAVRKGTRATRQFEIANTTTAPIAINVARSACRCLYYEYNDKIPAKKKETITVTIDGARAKVGVLQETIAVTAKNDPAIATSFQVQAAIK